MSCVCVVHVACMEHTSRMYAAGMWLTRRSSVANGAGNPLVATAARAALGYLLPPKKKKLDSRFSLARRVHAKEKARHKAKVRVTSAA